MNRIVNEVKTAWPYFVPAWLHAMLLPAIVFALSAFCRNGENCFALLYHLSFAVWLIALVPICKRLVGVSHAIAFILLPYLPYALFSIATMPD